MKLSNQINNNNSFLQVSQNISDLFFDQIISPFNDPVSYQISNLVYKIIYLNIYKNKNKNKNISNQIKNHVWQLTGTLVRDQFHILTK